MEEGHQTQIFLLPRRVHPSAIPTSHGCSNWVTISKEYDRFLKLCSIEPGSGVQLSFWKDTWTPLGPLYRSFPLLYSSSRAKEARVSEMGVCDNLGRTQWLIGTDRRLSDPEIAEYCSMTAALEGKMITEGPVKVSWLNSDGSTGSFAAKKYIQKLQHARLLETPQLARLTPLKQIWGAQVSPRCKLLLWLLFWNRLPTRDRLVRFGILDDSLCAMCNTADETISHLIFCCPVSATTWSWYRVIFNCRDTWDISSPGSAITSWRCAGLSPQGQHLWELGFAAIVHSIWAERNSRIFRNKSHGITALMRNVKLFIWDRVCTEDSFRNMTLDRFMFEWDNFIFE